MVTYRDPHHRNTTQRKPWYLGAVCGTLKKYEIGTSGGFVWKTDTRGHRGLGNSWMDMHPRENRAWFHQPQGATDAKDNLFQPASDLEISRMRETAAVPLPCLILMRWEQLSQEHC